jgi:glycine/D-amino acid oxidase-like deaminating enzyme
MGCERSYSLSYWERETFFGSSDIVIIGAGIVGLNAAIHLKKLRPHFKVRVVERGPVSIGASTRNAGFACFGSMTELLSNMKTSPVDDVFKVVQRRWDGLKKMRELLGDAAIGYEELGGYEVFSSSDAESFEECISKRQEFNTRMSDITGLVETYSVADERVSTFGLGEASHLILNQAEGQINTGKMMAALIKKANDVGVEIYCGINIKNAHTSLSGVELETDLGWSIKAAHVLVAVNGFAKKLLPNLHVVPARNHVLITEPVPNLKLKGCFHYDAGFYYFRNVGDRILLGGGRNLDLTGEATDSFAFNEIIQSALKEFLSRIVAPGVDAKIDTWWTGILGLGSDVHTITERVSDRMTVGVRLCGMGVAIGTLVGQEAAELALE